MHFVAQSEIILLQVTVKIENSVVGRKQSNNFIVKMEKDNFFNFKRVVDYKVREEDNLAIF